MQFNYEKFCPPKSHGLATKVQKSTLIQLLCNYPFDFTTTMQLSPWKYGELMNKFAHQTI
jgi:hypothetical protein